MKPSFARAVPWAMAAADLAVSPQKSFSTPKARATSQFPDATSR